MAETEMMLKKNKGLSMRFNSKGIILLAGLILLASCSAPPKKTQPPKKETPEACENGTLQTRVNTLLISKGYLNGHRTTTNNIHLIWPSQELQKYAKSSSEFKAEIGVDKVLWDENNDPRSCSGNPEDVLVQYYVRPHPDNKLSEPGQLILRIAKPDNQAPWQPGEDDWGYLTQKAGLPPPQYVSFQVDGLSPKGWFREATSITPEIVSNKHLSFRVFNMAPGRSSSGLGYGVSTIWGRATSTYRLKIVRVTYFIGDRHLWAEFNPPIEVEPYTQEKYVTAKFSDRNYYSPHINEPLFLITNPFKKVSLGVEVVYTIGDKGYQLKKGWDVPLYKTIIPRKEG